MPEDDRSARTEPPTPRRREQARQRGQVARSADLNSVLLLIGSVLFLRYYLPRLFTDLEDLFFISWAKFPKDLDKGLVYAYTMHLFLYIIKMLGPILLLMLGLGFIVNIMQVGVLFTGYPLLPRWERLNPIEGFKRFFSMRMLIQTLINVFKVLIVLWIVYGAFKENLLKLLWFEDMALRQALYLWFAMLFKVSMKILLFLFLLAVLDYGYNRWEHERSLMMSKEEIKEELKQMEGDPQIKARIRRLQRQLARQRMMKDVEAADVVITNPIHVAVALKYEPEKASAPVVVAKGMRLVAEKIKEIAAANEVPIVENPVLARAIYKTVEIGDPIPESLYKAVAEVLAYVYKLKNKVLA